ncbi:MAG: phosphate signaling complex protein PhoU [Pseudobdellovibrionaceae bacterium]
MMERHFEHQLDDLKKLILIMGGHVEKALMEAVQALISRDPERFKAVHAIEKQINENHLEVDLECMKILAQQAPVAKDLRLVISIVKINTDLERMGDQSVNIAHTGKHYLTGPAHGSIEDIRKMSELARKMVKDSLDAFVQEDTAKAQTVLEADDAVDEYKDKVFNELTSYMAKNTAQIESCLDLILIARNLERLADHATNIAEDVIYAFTGEDVRHGNANTGR